MLVRDASRDDVPRLVELLQQLSRGGEIRESDPRDPVYARAFDDIVADPHQRVLVVVDDALVLAMGEVRMTPNLSHKGRKVAHVESVVVDEEHRGRGVGKALMEYIEAAAQAAGCFRVELTSNAARKDAHRFYEALGYTASHVGFKKMLP